MSYLKGEIILVSLYRSPFHLYHLLLLLLSLFNSSTQKKMTNKTQNNYVVLKRITFKSETQTLKKNLGIPA